MISVICSTRYIDNKFVEMVKKTSGIEDIEILMYENNRQYSLTELYNKGLQESKNDIVVFLHDDIEILTRDWGKKLINHYNDEEEYGILGVAGSKQLSPNGVWWNNNESMYGLVNHTDGTKKWLNQYSCNFGSNIKNVVLVDGVFFSCNKKRIKKNFDEEYKGFHFYDISFCFDNFKEDVKVGVHFDINILHKSVGQVNDEWEANRQQFVTKELPNLPVFATIDVCYPTPNVTIKDEKKLAIVIPTKNKVDELLIPCIESIIENTKYGNYNIYVADTGSDESELTKTKSFIKNINKTKDIVRLIEYDYYNFAKINNDVVKTKIDPDTELVLFCNNDIEMLNDAVSIMAKVHGENKRAGTVGCRLHYENGSIQHLGVSLQSNKKNEILITHKYIRWDNENIKLSKTQCFTHGNTAAFMLVSKKLFEEIGGFNEDYKECFEDVEFNLQCMLKEKVNITTHTAACYHFESQTRERKGEDLDLKILVSFINKHPNLIKTFNKIENYG
jgi:GT2 family glycosyltransferase